MKKLGFEYIELEGVREKNLNEVYQERKGLKKYCDDLGLKVINFYPTDNNGLVNEHRALGRGTIDWDGVFTALKKCKFDGYVAVDVGRVKNLDEEITESVKFLGDIARKFKI